MTNTLWLKVGDRLTRFYSVKFNIELIGGLERSKPAPKSLTTSIPSFRSQRRPRPHLARAGTDTITDGALPGEILLFGGQLFIEHVHVCHAKRLAMVSRGHSFI